MDQSAIGLHKNFGPLSESKKKDISMNCSRKDVKEKESRKSKTQNQLAADESVGAGGDKQ